MGKHNTDNGATPSSNIPYAPLGSGSSSNFTSSNSNPSSSTPTPDPSMKEGIQEILKEFYEKKIKKEIDAVKTENEEIKKENASLKEKMKSLEEKVAPIAESSKKSELKCDAFSEELKKYKEELKKNPGIVESDYQKAHPLPDKWAYFHFVIMGDEDKTKKFSPNPNNKKNDELFKNAIGSKEPEAIKKWLKAEADDDEPGVDHRVITKPCWIDPETNEAKEVLTPEERKRLGIF